MKYYPGDIVEIMNITSDQATKIGYATKTYIRDMDKKVIGQRYEVVECWWSEFGGHSSVRVDGYEFHRPSDSFNVSQVRLYHRPLKNRIKAAFEKMRKAA